MKCLHFGLDSANFHVNLYDILFAYRTHPDSRSPFAPAQALQIKHNVHFYARQAIKMP